MANGPDHVSPGKDQRTPDPMERNAKQKEEQFIQNTREARRCGGGGE